MTKRTVHVKLLRESSGVGALESAERIAKVLGIVAIPVLVAVFGANIQKRLGSQAVQKDYVALAITVLSDPDADRDLRAWSARLLTSNAPENTPISSVVAERLAAGTVTLPSTRDPSDGRLGSGPSVAQTPDGSHVIARDDGALDVFTVEESGRFVRSTLEAHRGPVLSVAMRPGVLLSGGQDGQARVWHRVGNKWTMFRQYDVERGPVRHVAFWERDEHYFVFTTGIDSWWRPLSDEAGDYPAGTPVFEG